MRIHKYILLSCLLIVSTLGFSQQWKLSRSSYTYGVGISNYFGDIGGASKADASPFADLDLAYSRPVLAVGFYYKLYERIAVKGNLSYANIHGSDANSQNANRNYTFTTNMVELNGHVEYHILKEMQMVSYSKMSMRGKVNKFNVGINLYVFAGIGGAYFKPKAKDNLTEEPRFNDSKNLALVFPVGLGIKYPLTSITSIGLELGGRFTTTDYIDGFSTESSTSNDIYYFTVINVSTKIKRSKRRR
jgi:opacity protein-like surface antigen